MDSRTRQELLGIYQRYSTHFKIQSLQVLLRAYVLKILAGSMIAQTTVATKVLLILILILLKYREESSLMMNWQKCRYGGMKIIYHDDFIIYRGSNMGGMSLDKAVEWRVSN